MTSNKTTVWWPGFDIPEDEDGKTWKYQKKNSKIINDIEKDCWKRVK